MSAQRKIALVCATAFLALGSAQTQAATIIDVSSTTAAGTTAFLQAGDYSFDFISTAQGGAYDAWNAWSNVSGCNGQGTNCGQGWIVSLALDLGNMSSAFDRTSGLYFAQVASAQDSLRYGSAAAANAQAESALYRVASLTPGTSSLAYPPLTFSLATAQTVNFFIPDRYYADNTGGVSIALTNLSTAVPEPASWAMMLVGFGALGTMLRRKNSRSLSFSFA